MKLIVGFSDAAVREYGLTESTYQIDLDALLRLPFDDLVALEDEMAGGASLALLRLNLHEYSARTLRGVAYLALRNADSAPQWQAFKPTPADVFYVQDLGGDADPPAPGSGDSSVKAPGRTSSKSARTSRRSTTSRRTA